MDLFFSGPPTQGTLWEFLQTVNFRPLKIMAWYFGLAAGVVVLVVAALSLTLDVDEDVGGRGSTVRSRRLQRKREAKKGGGGGREEPTGGREQGDGGGQQLALLGGSFATEKSWHGVDHDQSVRQRPVEERLLGVD